MSRAAGDAGFAASLAGFGGAWLVAGCGGGAGVPCGGCEPGYVCFEDFTTGACVPDCSSDAGVCLTGLSCQPYDGSSVCQCNLATCGPRQDCLDPLNGCQTVDCSARVQCLTAGDICDVNANRCLPSNGSCASGTPCLTLVGPPSSETVIACDPSSLTCRASTVPIDVEFVSAPAQVPVASPTPGTLFSAPSLPSFTWDGGGAAAIVQVLTGVPSSSSDVANLVIWGAAISAGGAQTLSWGDGRPVQSGTWLSQSPSPPGDGIYFLWVQTVFEGTLLATSRLIPFGVGDYPPWKQPGNACAVSGFPGDCASPARPQACFNGMCMQLCASDLDCAPFSCLPPQQGVRFCGL
jgi:hypothetical protein